MYIIVVSDQSTGQLIVLYEVIISVCFFVFIIYTCIHI